MGGNLTSKLNHHALVQHLLEFRLLVLSRAFRPLAFFVFTIAHDALLVAAFIIGPPSPIRTKVVPER